MLKSLQLVLVAVFAIAPTVLRLGPWAESIPIDNGVEADPAIVCHSDRIEIDFKTRNPFEGHVYVKGRYYEPGCRSDSNAGARSAAIVLPFSKCGVQRTRSLNPRGVYVRTVVVITFHPQFLTKVDRAYAIQCFYMESDKTVSQQLEVSELTTAALTQQTPMPVCRYDVLENGPDGPPVRFATIGEQVYHKWTCESVEPDTFCMIVRNCQVHNGAGNQAQLLDDNGCSVDRYLLQNLEYTGDLMAGQEAHVFKFADQPALYFQCQITISVKDPGSNCPRPQCTAAVAGLTRIYAPVYTTAGYGPQVVPGQVILNAAPPQLASPVPVLPVVPLGGVGVGSPPPVFGPAAPAIVPPPGQAIAPPPFSRRQAQAALFASGPGFLQNDKPLNVSANGTNGGSVGGNVTTVGLFPIPNAGVGVTSSRSRRARSADTRPEPVREVGIWDVDAQPITALEIDENAAYYQTQATRFKNGLSPAVISFQASDAAIEDRRAEICLNTITFGFIFSVAIAAALAAGTAMIIVCKKKSGKF